VPQAAGQPAGTPAAAGAPEPGPELPHGHRPRRSRAWLWALPAAVVVVAAVLVWFQFS
jgi:hypothetical protein